MLKPLKKLTPRHKRFCQYYVMSFNAAESFEKAGYPPKNKDNYPYLLLRNKLIKDEISRLLKEAEISAEELKGKIQKFVDSADNDSNKLRACELMAKIKGIVKSDTSQHVNVMVDATQKTEDILAKRFGKQASTQDNAQAL